MLKGFFCCGCIICVEFVCYVRLGFSLMIVEVFVGMVESEFHFKQLYFKESLTFQYMLKKIIKCHLQNTPICSSLKRRKKKKREERKGTGMNIWAKTILFS